MIFEEGDQPNWLGVLRSGYLRQERLTKDGRRTLIDLAVPGDVVGGLPGHPASYSLEAATDVEICVFDPDILRRELEENCFFRLYLLKEAADRVEKQRALTWRRGMLTSRERIIAFLVMATEIMPVERFPDGGIIVSIELSRADWADLTNTSVESISRTMSQLSEKGHVESLPKGRYRIRDLSLLVSLAGMDPTHYRLGSTDDEPSDAHSSARTRRAPKLTAVNAAERPKAILEDPEGEAEKPAGPARAPRE